MRKEKWKIEWKQENKRKRDEEKENRRKRERRRKKEKEREKKKIHQFVKTQELIHSIQCIQRRETNNLPTQTLYNPRDWQLPQTAAS